MSSENIADFPVGIFVKTLSTGKICGPDRVTSQVKISISSSGQNALRLFVSAPEKQLWRQGVPLPFSLTVVSTN